MVCHFTNRFVVKMDEDREVHVKGRFALEKLRVCITCNWVRKKARYR